MFRIYFNVTIVNTYKIVIYNIITKTCYGTNNFKPYHIDRHSKFVTYEWFDPYKERYNDFIEFNSLDDLVKNYPELFI